MRAYIEKDHRDWDSEVPIIACGLRTTKHESTGFTLFKINIGNSMEIDGKRDILPSEMIQQHDVENNFNKLKNIREMVEKNLKSAYQKYSRQYNLRTKSITFEPG